MKLLEEKLPDTKFMLVHRSFIVNLDKIKTIERNQIVFAKIIFLSQAITKSISSDF
jgi:DNA-binding LytR/AlgR family response regulator